MIPRQPHGFPDHIERKLRAAQRLEWWSLAWLASIVVVMYLAMGNSQAMKTAWIEDMLSMVAPVVILLALKLRQRPANARFPYGFNNAVSIAFLCAAVALAGVGLFLLWDGASALLRREHPSIGSTEWFGVEFWQGWVMLAALAYSAIPPVILGRMKLRMAPDLHLKPLYTDAQTNKADWMTALAGILGVLGIGMGWWWADAAAAMVIALDVTRDGIRNLRNAFGDLLGRRPEEVDRDDEDPLVARVHSAIAAVAGVARADVRLREEGETLVGEAFFEPTDPAHALDTAAAVRQAALAVDWRVRDIVAMPVRRLEALDRGDGRASEDSHRHAAVTARHPSV